MSSNRPKGFTLIEICVVLAIIGIIACCAVPAFATYRRHASVIAAANELRGMLRNVRARAIARNRHAGVKFKQSGNVWTFSLYDDGDGDGVHNDDITSGVDKRYSGPSIVAPESHIATIALLPITVRDPDGDLMPPTKPAVQFGTSTICSFGPEGEGTPGSIYITDGAGELYAVRVYGGSGKVRLLRYERVPQRWVER